MLLGTPTLYRRECSGLAPDRKSTRLNSSHTSQEPGGCPGLLLPPTHIPKAQLLHFSTTHHHHHIASPCPFLSMRATSLSSFPPRVPTQALSIQHSLFPTPESSSQDTHHKVTTDKMKYPHVPEYTETRSLCEGHVSVLEPAHCTPVGKVWVSPGAPISLCIPTRNSIHINRGSGNIALHLC